MFAALLAMTVGFLAKGVDVERWKAAPPEA